MYTEKRVYSSIYKVVTSPKKNLVICPVCLLQGKRNVLAELTPKGVTILRFHNGSTTINSTNFTISCSCGETVYIKENESSHYRF